MADYPRIFTLDCVISEEPPYRVKCIEVNGANFGSRGFMHCGDLGFYRRYIRAIGSVRPGKPVFKKILGYKENCPIMQKAVVAALTKEYKAQTVRANAMEEALDGFCTIESYWLKDELDYNIRNCTSDRGLDDAGCYGAASVQEGVEFYPYRHIEFEDGRIKFTLGNGEIARYTPEEIGVIHGSSLDRRSLPHSVSHLFVNSEAEEVVMNDKALTDIAFDKYVRKGNRYGSHVVDAHLPASLVYGLGLTTPMEFDDFLDELECTLVAKKPTKGGGGIGVDFFPTWVMRSFDHMARPNEYENSTLRGLLNFIKIGLTSYDSYANYISLLQEYIPSVPIEHEITKELHHGCSRTVVFVPPRGQPMVLGSYWRLGRHPLGADVQVKDMFVANVSQHGWAQAMPIQTQLKIAHEIEELGRVFSSMLDTCSHNTNSRLQSRRSRQPAKAVMRNILWEHAIDRVAKEYGLSTSPSSRDSEPFFMRDQIRMTRQLLRAQHKLQFQLFVDSFGNLLSDPFEEPESA